MSVVETFGTDPGVDYRRASFIWGLILGSEFAVKHAPMFDGLSLDGFATLDDDRSPAEVSVCRRHVVQALALMRSSNRSSVGKQIVI
ncbi:hypothetical protein [Novosphingobium resinovorum]|uniref:hypothetical protein n=1 Tax=Novosphingobium resinovorum TaxID=158500 RepID=UPI002ED6951E|nr:hypothetical protein [Novosphingobium resinovorum]